MKQIRLLRIHFDCPLRGYELSSFRGAISAKAGLEHHLFHNHRPDKGFFYRYPQIQYKIINHKPALLCLNEGVEEVHHFFQNKNWDMQIGERKVSLGVDKIDLKKFNLNVWETSTQYRISNWIGINQKNYPEFMALNDDESKIEFLEKKLIGNIISMAKGVGWDVDKQIKLRIHDYNEPRKTNLKGVKVDAFSLRFRANISLPDYIGLGKSVSLGYGIITRVRNQNTQ